MDKFPRKIDKVPIAEAVLEVRFDTPVPEEAVFGIVYNAFKTQFSRLEKLQLLQLPNEIRNLQPDLKFKPLYKIYDEKYFIQIGPKVFSINIHQNKYPGWHVFREDINKYFDLFNGLNIATKYNRFGLRYINFFKEDIIGKTKFEIVIDGEKHHSPEMMFRTVINEGDYKKVLQINNVSIVGIKDGIPQKGSVVDIDIICETLTDNFVKDFPRLIENAHEMVRQQFFSLLKEETIKSLNPTYE